VTEGPAGIVDPFAGYDLIGSIAARAGESGLELPPEAIDELAAHARAVLRENSRLKLTSITRPDAFVERHVGESLWGAAMLAPGTSGGLLDLGSGNGYPGFPVAATRRLLEPWLAESNGRKARFLRELLNDRPGRGGVIETHVERAADLESIGPIRVVCTRAMGGWERVLPRLRPCLAEDGELLVWAGADLEKIAARAGWRRFELVERRALPGRDGSWVWRFRSA
jgi:16S rRNA (guanine527-N7)-methyltransferase